MQLAARNEITDALKVALRSRGLTYKDLAEKLNLSEKTIKRLFSEQDCSLSRLDNICSAINLSVFDLMDFARQYKEPHAKLSPAQEQFLAENRAHFNFMFMLTIGYSAEQIQERYKLSELGLFRYLRDLDAQDLIALGANNQFRLLIKGKLLLKLHGPLHNILRDANTLFLEHVVDNEAEPGVSFRSAYRFISKETLVELGNDFEELNNKYQKLAQRDEAVLPRDKLIGVKWVTLASPFEIFGKWSIPELKE